MQFFIEKTKKYDFYRTTKLSLFGLLFTAPNLHIWYNFYPKITNAIFSFPMLKGYASQNMKTLCGVFLDQTLFATYFLVCFFMIMDYVDSRNINNSFENMKSKFWPSMIVNWKIWPAAQLINFGLIPLNYRVLFANFIGLFWNCYLSYAQYKNEDKKIK